jgi:hypothetical protein
VADLDVTDLLLDTDLAGSQFTVLRRQEAIDTHGRSQLTTTPFTNVVGAVFPTGENSLVRQADFSTQASTITVVTMFGLRGASTDGTNNYQPDLVQWRGGNYIVKSVKPYLYGPGFVEAECTTVDLNAVPQI